MTISAMYSAATGMQAMDTKLDVIANNLANSNTTGFKSSRVNFEDLFYEARRQPGVLNAQGDRTSTGLFVGLGTRASNTQLNLRTGNFINTERPLDLAIGGQGFFKVQTFDGIGGGEAYTRAGNLLVNRDGDLILGNLDGPRIDPPLNFPQGTDFESVTITRDGRVSAIVDGVEEEVGQLTLFRFPNANGLRLEGGNLMTETEASGPPIEGIPAEDGFGTINQNMLEASNVDPVKELIGMIRTQRSFELNSQVIRAADQTLQEIGRLRT